MKRNTRQSLSPDFDLKALIYTSSSQRLFFPVTNWLTGICFMLLNWLDLGFQKEKPPPFRLLRITGRFKTLHSEAILINSLIFSWASSLSLTPLLKQMQ